MKNKKRIKKGIAPSKRRLKPKEIYLTPEDRITYIYKRDDFGKIIQVTNVSYEIRINESWITIVRYDSFHGILHRHRRVSLSDSRDTPTILGVKKKGSHENWLTWSISDIKRRYSDYRRGFLRRSNIKDS